MTSQTFSDGRAANGHQAQTARTGRRPIRVLEVVGNAIVGGVENYVRNLVRLLRSSEFEIEVLCPYETGVIADLRRQGHPIYVTPMKGGEPDVPWNAIQSTVGIIRGRQIDLLHAHLPKAQMIAGLAGALTGTPVVATFHGWQMTADEFSIHRLTDAHLIVVCQAAYGQALALGLPPERVTFIPNGVDLNAFTPGRDGSAFRHATGIPQDAPLVGWVGRLSPEKGPDQFVRAAAVVHAARPDIHFVLVGEGPMDHEVQRLIDNHGLQGCMHMAGLWTNTADVYPALDVLAQTSHSEGMPLVLLEGMACGRPVAAMAVGGVLEMIEFGGNGLLVTAAAPEEMGQTLLGLLDRPDRLEEMGRAARHRVEALYDLRGTVTQTAALLRTLAARGTGVRPAQARLLARSVRPGEMGMAGNGSTNRRPIGDQT